MKATTLATIEAVLNGDDSLKPADRKNLIHRLTQPDEPTATQPVEQPSRIIPKKEAAQRLGKKSTMTVDRLIKQKVLVPVFLPGRKRIAGVTEASLNALVVGKVAV